MHHRSFRFFRSVDAEIEFRGLRGRYFYFALGGGAGLLLVSMFLYMLGLPLLIMLALLVGGGGYGIYWCITQNTRHGRWGHIKAPQSGLSPDFISRHRSFRYLLPAIKLPRRSARG